MKDYENLEKIMILSEKINIDYQTLFYEYLNYRCIGLNPKPAYQYLEIKYIIKNDD